MLNNIRNLADNTIVRIFLAFIAISFVIWGVKSAMVGSNDYDLVTFQNAPNITENDFAKAKAREIRTIEQNTNAPLKEDEQQELQIDSIVLQKLITNRMIEHIADIYGLAVSDDFAIDMIKNYDIFKNSNGKFDITLFNSHFSNSYQKQEYLNNIKENIIKNTILTIFLEGFNPPTNLSDNIMKYLSETRIADLVSVDLYANNKNFIQQKPTESELQKFYDENHKLFTTDAKRSITYLKIPFETILNNIKILDDEALRFYNNNEKDFKGGKFINVKKRVVQKIKEQRLDKAISTLIANIEQDIASGSNIKEISSRYYGTLANLDNITHQDLIDNAELSQTANEIFAMRKEEVSYPIEQQDKKQVLVVELNNIISSTLEPFSEIKNKVIQEFNKHKIAEYNLKNFELLAKKYKAGDLTLTELKSDFPLQIKNFVINRSEINDKALPLNLLFLIFERDIGENTPVVLYDDKLYFAHVKSVNMDRKKYNEIEKENKNKIISTIKNGMMEEIIDYFARENDMKIKTSSK